MDGSYGKWELWFSFWSFTHCLPQLTPSWVLWRIDCQCTLLLLLFSPQAVSELFAAQWTAAHQASLTLTISWSLPKFMSIEWVMPSNYLILCHPLLLLPSVFPSISVFSNESALCIRWPKYWSFSFSISPSCEYSGLISFRLGWFDLLAVQAALKNLLQHFNATKMLYCFS